MQGNITDWGKEVKKGLIERGWSINDLAERIGKSRTRVHGASEILRRSGRRRSDHLRNWTGTGQPYLTFNRSNQMESQRNTVFRSIWITSEVPGCYDASEIWT